MNRYTRQERGIIVSMFLTQNRSVVLAQREFRRRFPGRVAPTGQTLRRLPARLEEIGSTWNSSRRGQPWRSRLAENIDAAAAVDQEFPQTSTRRRATQMAMINDFLLPQIDELGLENMWFQQDGATAHTAQATMDILQQAFPDRVISRFDDLHCPARSPDLTVPDFFLCGFLKSRVYTNKPQTLVALKEKVR